MFKMVRFGGRLLYMADGSEGGGASSEEGAGSEDAGAEGNEGGESTDGSEGDEGVEGDEEDLDKPMYSKRQISGIVSGRVNEAKKQYANYSQYQESVNMMGDIIGTKDPAVIHQHLKELHTAQQAKNMGMTPEGYTQYKESQRQTQSSVEAMKTEARAKEFDEVFSKSKGFEDSALFRDQILDIASKGLSLKEAYWAVAGELRSGKKAKASQFEAEQLALANQQKKGTKQIQPGGSGAPGGTKQPPISAEVKANAEKAGMDPVTYLAYQNPNLTIEEARELRKAAKAAQNK